MARIDQQLVLLESPVVLAVVVAYGTALVEQQLQVKATLGAKQGPMIIQLTT